MHTFRVGVYFYAFLSLLTFLEPFHFCTLEHHSNASSRNSYSSIIIIPLIIIVIIIIIVIPLITIIIIIIIIPLMLNIQFKRLLIKENIWPVKNPSVSNSKWWVPRWKFNRETVIDRLQARQASFILQTFNNLKQFLFEMEKKYWNADIAIRTISTIILSI